MRYCLLYILCFFVSHAMYGAASDESIADASEAFARKKEIDRRLLYVALKILHPARMALLGVPLKGMVLLYKPHEMFIPLSYEVLAWLRTLPPCAWLKNNSGEHVMLRDVRQPDKSISLPLDQETSRANVHPFLLQYRCSEDDTWRYLDYVPDYVPGQSYEGWHGLAPHLGQGLAKTQIVFRRDSSSRIKKLYFRPHFVATSP